MYFFHVHLQDIMLLEHVEFVTEMLHFIMIMKAQKRNITVYYRLSFFK